MRLLLDCHIAKATIPALRKKLPSVDSQHLAKWHGGAFLKAEDDEILEMCHAEHRAFVTFDQRTIPDLLRQWAAEERPHSGVIFGDENSVKPSVPGAVAAALAALLAELGDSDLLNAVRFLRAARR